MLNVVILQGRLTKDPELAVTPNGVSVTRFSLAVDRKFKKEGQSTADFINCIAFRNTAEFVKKYFTKGQMVNIHGSIQTSNWEKDGKKNYSTDVMVDEVHFCGDKKQEQGDQIQDDGFMTVDDDQLPF
jgi:single-strand DNA-binding protein